jgi:alkylated DNA repair dioxygenase AlkB
MERVRLKYDSWLDFDPAWLAPDEAAATYDALLALPSWEQLPITVFGRQILQPRLMTWAGEIPYRYSGLTLAPRPLDGLLGALAERVSAAAGARFNHVMLNLYRDGNDSMGMHADDERELGPEPLVGSLSLGAERPFVYALKNKKRSPKRHKLVLTHGSLLVMGGRFQHEWYHGVPKRASVDHARINVTFRDVKGPPGWRAPPPEAG